MDFSTFRFTHQYSTPLTLAIKRGLPDFVNLFLAQGNPLPSDVLHIALKHIGKRRTSEIIRALIQHNADVHAISEGNNPLHTLFASDNISLTRDFSSDEFKYACDISLENAQILVEAGCDIHAKNWGGRTPLDLATTNLQSQSVIQYLLDKGAHFRSDAIHALPHGPVIINPTVVCMMLSEVDAGATSSIGDMHRYVAHFLRISYWRLRRHL